MVDDTRQKLVPAVENAISILRLLASHGEEMGVTQIARDTQLNVSSVFNILRTLSYEGFLSFDTETKTYQIGPGILEFAAPLLGANPADLMRPDLTEIAERYLLMIALWKITDNQRIVLVDCFSAKRIVQAMVSPNSRLPAFSGAVGRCYAAATGLGKAAVKKGFNSVRWQSAPAFEEYWNDVQTARETRMATDYDQLFRGLNMVATVVQDHDDKPRFGISSVTIIGQHNIATLEKVGAELVQIAGKIERELYRKHRES